MRITNIETFTRGRLSVVHVDADDRAERQEKQEMRP